MLTNRGAATLENGNARLTLGEGNAGSYRGAQLDDYSGLARRRFVWRERATLRLRCRLSDPVLPGTWGFGLWNDPFSFSLGLGGAQQRLPALPNCAWFFYSSPHNHLSFQPEKPRTDPSPKSETVLQNMAQRTLPGNGFLAQTFAAPRIPSGLLASGLLGVPLLWVKPLSRWLRAQVAAKLIREDAQRLELDPTQWHGYRLRWSREQVEFVVDGEPVFATSISPQGPLGLVIWIDNQFAAWRPDGGLGLGLLANPPAWMEIEALEISQ